MSNTEHAAAVNTVIEDQVSLLRAEVHHQRDLILKLQQQLRSVLSVLGITEQDIQLTDVDKLEQISNTVTCQVDVVDHPACQPSLAEVTANTQLPHNPEKKKPRKLVTNFQQSLAAAVYVDQS